MIGATDPAEAKEGTIRKKYSKDTFEKADARKEDVYNMIHAPDSLEALLREVDILDINFKND